METKPKEMVPEPMERAAMDEMVTRRATRCRTCGGALHARAAGYGAKPSMSFGKENRDPTMMA